MPSMFAMPPNLKQPKAEQKKVTIGLLDAFCRSAAYEWAHLAKNRWDFSMVFWLPLLVIFLTWWVFANSQIKDLPIGVIDQDQGQVAQKLVQYLDASPDLKVVDSYDSIRHAKQAILSRKIYGVVIIPDNFEQQILRAQPSPIVLQVNAQYGTHSGIVQKGVQSVVATVSAGTEMQRLIKQGVASSQLSANYSPISIQRISLFNASTDYQLFLASTALPALLHILAMIIGATTVGREIRDYKLGEWYAYTINSNDNDNDNDNTANSNADIAPTPTDPALTNKVEVAKQSATSNLPTLIAALNGKLIWAMLAYTLWAAVVLTLSLQIHPVSLAAWAMTYMCLILLMMLSFWMGAIITLATFSLRVGLSATGFISAPSYAFAGVTFPYVAISNSAKYWTNTLPLTHYLRLHIAQLQMQAPSYLFTSIIYGFFVAVIASLLLTAVLTKRALNNPQRWGAR